LTHAPTRIAIVLTHNRHDMLTDAVASIAPQADLTFVIDNASSPPVDLAALAPVATVEHPVGLVYAPEQPPNLPRLWALGLAMAKATQRGEDGAYYVAFVQDDCLVPASWFSAVVAAMKQTGAAAGCSNPFGTQHDPILKTAHDGDLMGRMVGWAFVLDGTRGLTPDQSMPWWWSDTDLDWQARLMGGMVMVGSPGLLVTNRLPNDHTQHVPGLAEQAGKDRATFAAKWGGNPW
jgi:hypothetical protein